MIRNITYNDYIKFINLSNININKETFDLFVNNLNPNHHLIIVYEENNEIIGTGTLLIERKLTYNISYLGHIENIFVDKDHRNKGIGKKITTYLINHAKKNLCYRIDLACEENLINFYQNLGFDKKLYCMSMLNSENFK
jgi:glucosamine-phosphate N-acetyltransferase